MADTCSFRVNGGNIVRDSMCFASFRSSEKCYILIEEKKFSISKELFEMSKL